MHRLSRGTTVAYGPHYGVVWLAPAAGPVILFPILVGRRRALAGDIELELEDLIAAGIELPLAWLRPTAPQRHEASDLRRRGQLGGRILQTFQRGVDRAVAHAAFETRYAHGARMNCQLAERLPVRMDR